MTALPEIAFKPGAEKRVLRGHPWVFSNEIEMSAGAKALAPGSPVHLTVKGEVLATALFNPHTLIAARIVGAGPVIVDHSFIGTQIEASLALRDRFFDRPFYRLIHAEGDGLPGLVVDRFGDVLAVQANSAGMDRLLPDLLEVLSLRLSPRAIVVRNDSPARETEGLERSVEVVRGTLDGAVTLEENGLRFLADLEGGQKTGWFYDHRENRAAVAALASGARVLDLYCHTGGFAIACAAAGAASVTGIDRAASAVSLATRSAALNGVEATAEFRKADAFAVLEHFQRAGEMFDIVIADPPAFVKSRKDLATGVKGYRKLARLAASLVTPGGLLLAASCSHLVSAEDLRAQTARGITEAGRSGRLLRTSGAGPDHPVHLHLAETAYLKALLIELD